MKNMSIKIKNNHYSPFVKIFYRISKERLEAYLDKLNDASEYLRKLKPTSKKEKGKIEQAQGSLIDIFNSLYGFKNYEDIEAGGEGIQDLWFSQPTTFDNDKFYEIEFPEGKKIS